MSSILSLADQPVSRNKCLRTHSTGVAAAIVDLTKHRRLHANQVRELSKKHGRKGGVDIFEKRGGQCLVDACVPTAMAAEWQRLAHLYGVPDASFEMRGDPDDTMRLVEVLVPAWMARKFEQQFAAYKAA